jgi:uncharacterized protein (DUF2235 family)
MSKNSDGPDLEYKPKARVDVEYIGGIILIAALSGIITGLFFGWWQGLYVGSGVVVVAFALLLFRVLLERSGKLYTDIARPNPSPLSDGPRKHIICLDGTWNLPRAPTNVRKVYEWVHLADDRQHQIGHYYPGVGTRELTDAKSELVKEWLSKTMIGGASAYGPFGALSILKRAYFEFVDYYRPGDQIFIFGFSRGAAIARALANYICKTHGLPDSVMIEYQKARLHADIVINFAITDKPELVTPEVELLGLWDTVGSTGNPLNERELLDLDLTIPSKVKKVYHLVAIHERRRTFGVKLIEQEDRVEEIWFPGWHSNVGGGLKDHTLSDIALRFMVSRAKELGLKFRKDPAEIACDLEGDLRKVFWRPVLGEPSRQVRVLSVNKAKARIHKSVFRLKNAHIEYDPKNIPNEDEYTHEERD